MTAYGAFWAGLATGAIGMVTVLSSLASGVAVLIGPATLGEEVASHQWGGLAMILNGPACRSGAVSDRQ